MVLDAKFWVKLSAACWRTLQSAWSLKMTVTACMVLPSAIWIYNSRPSPACTQATHYHASEVVEPPALTTKPMFCPGNLWLGSHCMQWYIFHWTGSLRYSSTPSHMDPSDLIFGYNPSVYLSQIWCILKHSDRAFQNSGELFCVTLRISIWHHPYPSALQHLSPNNIAKLTQRLHASMLLGVPTAGACDTSSEVAAFAEGLNFKAFLGFRTGIPRVRFS